MSENNENNENNINDELSKGNTVIHTNKLEKTITYSLNIEGLNIDIDLAPQHSVKISKN